MRFSLRKREAGKHPSREVEAAAPGVEIIATAQSRLRGIGCEIQWAVARRHPRFHPGQAGFPYRT
jgi:hypothetical protein